MPTLTMDISSSLVKLQTSQSYLMSMIRITTTNSHQMLSTMLLIMIMPSTSHQIITRSMTTFMILHKNTPKICLTTLIITISTQTICLLTNIKGITIIMMSLLTAMKTTSSITTTESRTNIKNYTMRSHRRSLVSLRKLGTTGDGEIIL